MCITMCVCVSECEFAFKKSHMLMWKFKMITVIIMNLHMIAGKHRSALANYTALVDVFCVGRTRWYFQVSIFLIAFRNQNLWIELDDHCEVVFVFSR